MKTLDPNQIVGFHRVRVDLSIWLLCAARDRMNVLWRFDDYCAHLVDRDGVPRWPLPFSRPDSHLLRRELRSLAENDDAGRFLLLVGDRRVTVEVEETDQSIAMRLDGTEECGAVARAGLAELRRIHSPIRMHLNDEGVVDRVEPEMGYPPQDGPQSAVLIFAAIAAFLVVVTLVTIGVVVVVHRLRVFH